MKKLFLIAVAGLFFAANSNAQVQREIPHTTTCNLILPVIFKEEK